MGKTMELELEKMVEDGWKGPWKSVYLGGGTPSLLKEEVLTSLFETINRCSGIANDAEISLEANPEDIFPERLKHWQSLGINRLSLGVQSFADDDLKWMNRHHSADQAVQAVHAIREAGFQNFSIDLIYGLPESAHWTSNLEKAFSLNPPHLSAYALTVEERTVLGNRVRKGQQHLLPDETVEAQYQALCSMASTAGMEHYEISNFARKGSRAQHNAAYWKGEPYLGLGPSAHSFNGIERWWNVANNQQYKQLLNRGMVWYERETLSDTDRWNELLMTALRCVEGFNETELRALLPKGAFFPERELAQLARKGWLIENQGQWQIPEIHWLLADHITASLML